MELKSYHNSLKLRKTVEGCYLSEKIDREGIFRIAIDSNHNPAILIASSKIKRSERKTTNFKLTKLLIEYDVESSIIDTSNDQYSKEVFHLIKQIDGNNHIQEYFLLMMEGVIEKVKDDPTLDTITNEIQYLVDLFSHSKRLTEKETLGLWGELFVILNSEDTNNYIEAWRLESEDLFDFSFGERVLEVKTTTNRNRLHTFNNNQIKNYLSLNVEVASIITEKVDIGLSINDLWGDIKRKTSDSTLINKIGKVISKTIKNDHDALFTTKFDKYLAESSLKIINGNLIPHIEDDCLSPGITNISLKINLEQLFISSGD